MTLRLAKVFTALPLRSLVGQMGQLQTTNPWQRNCDTRLAQTLGTQKVGQIEEGDR